MSAADYTKLMSQTTSNRLEFDATRISDLLRFHTKYKEEKFTKNVFVV